MPPGGRGAGAADAPPDDQARFARRKVFLIDDGVKQSTSPATAQSGSSEEGRLVNLHHPRYDSLCKYMIRGGNVLEIQKIETHRPSSWIIDQSIKSDGSMFLCTKVDMAFFVLPFAYKCKEQQPLSLRAMVRQCGRDEDAEILCALPGFEVSAKRICDVTEGDQGHEREGDGARLFKFSLEKAKAWITRKVQRTKAHLVARASAGAGGANNAVVSSFNLGKKVVPAPRDSSMAGAGAHETDQLKLALELVGSNVGVELFDALTEEFTEDVEVARECQAQHQALHDSKFAMDGGDHPVKPAVLTNPSLDSRIYVVPTDENEVVKEEKKSLSEPSHAYKRLAKTDVRGMASITTFFSKKPPKKTKEKGEAEEDGNKEERKEKKAGKDDGNGIPESKGAGGKAKDPKKMPPDNADDAKEEKAKDSAALKQ